MHSTATMESTRDYFIEIILIIIFICFPNHPTILPTILLLLHHNQNLFALNTLTTILPRALVVTIIIVTFAQHINCYVGKQPETSTPHIIINNDYTTSTPQHQVQQISDYVSATTTAMFAMFSQIIS